MSAPRTHHTAMEQIRVLVPIGDVSKLEVLAEVRSTHITALVREAIAKFLENK